MEAHFPIIILSILAAAESTLQFIGLAIMQY